MAFTSGEPCSSSDTGHGIQLQSGSEENAILLPDRPGDDYESNKGDLWDISLSSFGFSDDCMTINEIQRVSIVARGSDGWNIGSIVTLVRDSINNIQVLSQDFSVNRWIDSDVTSQRQLDLTLSGKFHLNLYTW